MSDVLLSPPVAFAVFWALAWGIHRLGGRLASPGPEHPSKNEPYACGEEMPPGRVQLRYGAFFRLALMFAVLHLAALMISTLPAQGATHRFALAYLAGATLTVLVLTRRISND